MVLLWHFAAQAEPCPTLAHPLTCIQRMLGGMGTSNLETELPLPSQVFYESFWGVLCRPEQRSHEAIL